MNLQNGTPHQQVELKEIPLDVTDHIPQSGTCSSCGHSVTGEIPEGSQYFYGPRFTAFVASLVSHGVSRRVVEELLRDARVKDYCLADDLPGWLYSTVGRSYKGQQVNSFVWDVDERFLDFFSHMI